MPINNGWIKAGALVAALAVVLGGLGTETLIDLRIDSVTDSVDKTLGEDTGADDPRDSNQADHRSLQLAIYFQLAHALAIIAVGILLVLQPGRLLKASAWCFLFGTILFSGSIYLSVLTATPWLEPVKLAGIVALVIGWILLVEGACPDWNKPATDNTEQQGG